MFNNYKNEFNRMISPILENKEFIKIRDKKHHGTTRFDHLIRVSYYSYLITRILNLNYQETARAALLHDFFLDEVDDCGKIKALQKHPYHALENAKKYYDLTDREEDIIKTHMFPVTFVPPRYLEGWIVDLVDDIAGVYEQYKSSCKQLQTAVNLLFILIVNIIQK